jgi:hypothetical protein
VERIFGQLEDIAGPVEKILGQRARIFGQLAPIVVAAPRIFGQLAGLPPGLGGHDATHHDRPLRVTFHSGRNRVGASRKPAFAKVATMKVVQLGFAYEIRALLTPDEGSPVGAAAG